MFFSVALFPLSNQLTRLGGAGLATGIWLGLLLLTWQHRRVRNFLVALTISAALFLALPIQRRSDVALLRQDYVQSLQRYTGVPYCWGGESFKGIDCSGLIRRGLIDALFCRGLRPFEPQLIRYSIQLWWHDCTANDLGNAHPGRTDYLFDIPGINSVEESRLKLGDLAVTRNGSHILAYLGRSNWIEADPGEGRVVAVPAPSNNPWFNTPMKIMRWSVLQQ